jgi:hypothetical protein
MHAIREEEEQRRVLQVHARGQERINHLLLLR